MNQMFLVNILLAIAWAAMSGAFSLPNLIFGFVIGLVSMFIIREQMGTLSHLLRARRVLSLFMLFLVELVKSATRVALLALKPNLEELKPGFFAYELNTDRDAEIALLAGLITLTPGTLSVDVSDDKKYLYIHAVTIDDLDAMKADIANGFEKKILEAFR
ncbi:Na+/H+ antiporter subunit E [uncultured Cohaesibacter sp.]|uniref:Na+/H+ antiporter subunit E n=1 Tax=uncultured Cohaesibacter sp. TaxID=1002546 RepID=UPI0029C785D6|nr:Na+/H+ antiporter subunit E [uncultured Cohaesibacter sp.]